MTKSLREALSTRYLFYLQIINFPIEINKNELKSHKSYSFAATDLLGGYRWEWDLRAFCVLQII